MAAGAPASFFIIQNVTMTVIRYSIKGDDDVSKWERGVWQGIYKRNKLQLASTKMNAATRIKTKKNQEATNQH